MPASLSPFLPHCLCNFVCLFSVFSLSFSLSSAFPNGAAKLLFPSHYRICASPLSCKSSRYSSLFSINSTAVKLQLPITKHCWGRKEEQRQRQEKRDQDTRTQKCGQEIPEKEREKELITAVTRKKDRNEGQFKEMRDSFRNIMCYICWKRSEVNLEWSKQGFKFTGCRGDKCFTFHISVVKLRVSVENARNSLY